MKTIKGKTVLVTGGAQGMGKSYVKNAAKEGAKNVIIWDLNESEMQKTAAEFSNETTKIYCYKVDVTNTELVYELAEEITKKIGPVHLLINNAGIVVSENFIDHSPKKIDLTMQINSIAPMHIARAFLPGMVETEEAHIVNIASGAAYMYCPKIITYCSSKWAIYGWSQGLNVELQETHPHIKVTTVTPGHIDTGMFDGAHSALMPLISPQTMVDAVWKGIKKNKTTVVRPKRLGLVPLVRGIAGVRGWNRISKVTGINDFMAGV